MSVWCSQSAAIPGPLGAVPMASAIPWSNAPESMLVKLSRMYPGCAPGRKDKSNSQMPTLFFHSLGFLHSPL